MLFVSSWTLISKTAVRANSIQWQVVDPHPLWKKNSLLSYWHELEEGIWSHRPHWQFYQQRRIVFLAYKHRLAICNQKMSHIGKSPQTWSVLGTKRTSIYQCMKKVQLTGPADKATNSNYESKFQKFVLMFKDIWRNPKQQEFYHHATNHRSFEKALSCSWVVKKALLHFEPNVDPPKKMELAVTQSWFVDLTYT